MQGYEASKQGNTYGRRKSSCSYCNSQEHQVTHCPHVLGDWKSIRNGKMPLAQAQSRGSFPQWYFHGTNWGNWYKEASKGATKRLAFIERQEAKKKSGAKKVKRVSSCGFCGSTGHTRRNCPVQTKFLADIAVANRNYREYIYDTLVKKDGLSTGAIVRFKVKTGGYYSEDVEALTTLATKVNWDTINLLAEREFQQWQEINKSSAKIGVGAERLNNLQNYLSSSVYINFVKDGKEYRAPFYGGDAKEVGNNSRYHYTRLRMEGEATIVSRAPQVLAEDWVDGYQDAFKHLTKKCSWAELQALKVDELVEKWKTWTASE